MDARRWPSVQSLTVLTKRKHEPHMETELIDPTGRWCLNPSQPRLSRLLASLRRFAIFDWTGFSNLKGLSTSNDRCVLSLALAAIAFRAKQRNGYGPFLLGMLAAAAVLLGKFV